MSVDLLQSDAIRRACRSARTLLLNHQKLEGDWEGEMVWCTMITALSVIVRTVVGVPYEHSDRESLIHYFQVTQSEEGAWGMHPESQGYVFFTTLAYIALRFLGLLPDHPLLERARIWLHAQPDGVKAIPTWGKFWLATLGLYRYEGINSVPPELFFLPTWLPFHPSRFYCHTRLIYLGIAFVFGKRFVAELPLSLREALRSELYKEPYDEIDFNAYRHILAPSDVYVPITPLLRFVYDGIAWIERKPCLILRSKALEVCFQRILYEQHTTRYQGISPVNALLNCLAIFAHDPQHPELIPSLEGIEAWRWKDTAEGLRHAGARSNTWDTAFVLQALAEIPCPDSNVLLAAERAHAHLEKTQMSEELPDYRRFWRDPSKGGWCFSNGEHHWPVSDCTAEALSALLTLYEWPEYLSRLPETRLREAVLFLLSRQNKDGGFGTYERRRGGKFLEYINPSEMFGQCMTELSYIECTGSAITALCHYLEHYTDFLQGQIRHSIQRGVQFLKSQQQADGAWAGFWGIYYTYGTFHAVRGLRKAGILPDDPILRAAAHSLIEKQHQDGGWGEHYSVCLKGYPALSTESQPVQTSWALLALLDSVPTSHHAITRGIQWLSSQQHTDGSWPHRAVNGVFFGAAMLDYRLYHNYFPTWALSRYARLVDCFPVK